MVKLFDIISEDESMSLSSIANRGDIVLVNADKIGGFRKSSTKERQEKFVVILGEDEANVMYGILLINSQDYATLGDDIRNHSYPIYPKDYSFLTHSSFVYCGEIKTIEKNKFSEAMIKSISTIRKEDMRLILDTIIDSQIVPKKTKRSFKLLD